MTLLLNDLKRHTAAIEHLIRPAIERVLARGYYILGPEVEGFEQEFAAYCGVKYCVGVGNGTDALEIALRTLDIGPGDEVATVANAGMYSSTAIVAVGAEPLYIDVEDRWMTMDAIHLAAMITDRTRAIIATHLFGKMVDFQKIQSVADHSGIPIIEDCAQAHGAVLSGKKAGSLGTIGCFSFYPTKNLGALGDGGAITTSDPGLADKTRQLRQYGWERKYHAHLPGGMNSRLDELQAAILREKITHLDRWNDRRRALAGMYSRKLQEVVLAAPPLGGQDYVAHLYVVRTPHRSELQRQMLSRQIYSDIHYPVPDHHQSIFKQCHFSRITLPITEQCCHEVLSLPCFPEMTDQESDQVIRATIETFPR